MQILEITTPSELRQLAVLAEEIWSEHYTPIIGAEQVRYMIERFQNAAVMQQQIARENYRYFVTENDGQYFAYCALQKNSENAIFLSKLYVEKTLRGKGVGKKLLLDSLERMNPSPETVVWLTVNKNNADSIAAYKRMGFSVAEELLTDIGNGFFMDDYRMQATVCELFAPLKPDRHLS